MTYEEMHQQEIYNAANNAEVIDAAIEDTPFARHTSKPGILTRTTRIFHPESIDIILPFQKNVAAGAEFWPEYATGSYMVVRGFVHKTKHRAKVAKLFDRLEGFQPLPRADSGEVGTIDVLGHDDMEYQGIAKFTALNHGIYIVKDLSDEDQFLDTLDHVIETLR